MSVATDILQLLVELLPPWSSFWQCLAARCCTYMAKNFASKERFCCYFALWRF